jgi:hypothetical protein
MLPSVLLAAAFTAWERPVVRTFNLSGPPPTVPSWMFEEPGLPFVHPLEMWGDPPHLRGYPWGRGLPREPEPAPSLKRLSPPEKTRVPPASATPTDTTAERIAALEHGIALLRTNRGSQQSIDLLQHELDALKTKQK